MQLTNEEVARVFAMYLGGECEPTLITAANYTYTNRAVKLEHIDTMVRDGNKLLLTPLSSITDEHAIEVAELTEHDIEILRRYNWLKLYLKVRSGNILITFMPQHDRNEETDWLYLSNSAYQHLVQQGYAVPLFFGLNHWANGKTAIELGIAIEKP